MKKLLLPFLFLVPIFGLSQSKKGRIEILENQIDSCIKLLTDRLITINRQNELISNEKHSITALNYEIDSLRRLININKIQTENQNNNIKKLNQEIDSLSLILLEIKDELISNSKPLLDFSSDSILEVLKLTTEERPHTDIDAISPIGWSEDGTYFAYIYSFNNGGGNESTFNVLNTKNNTEIIKNLVINSNISVVDSTEFFFINQLLNSVLKTYKIIPRKNITIKNLSELYNAFGFRYNLIKKSGRHDNKKHDISRIYLFNYKATIKDNNGNTKTLLENSNVTEDIIDILDGGFISDPNNDQIIIFMIKETGPGFENYNHWDISLYPIDLKNIW